VLSTEGHEIVLDTILFARLLAFLNIQIVLDFFLEDHCPRREELEAMILQDFHDGRQLQSLFT
jgi:hypothetical protein